MDAPEARQPAPRAAAFSHEGRRYIPVDPESLGDGTLRLPLFLRHDTAAEPVLYRSAGIHFTADAAARLRENGVSIIYVLAEDHGAYRQMLGKRFSSLLASTAANPERHAGRVRTACAGLVEDVLASPGQPEAVEAVAEVSRHLGNWATRHEDAFTFLMEMTAHDYYTASHMVNVSVGCGLLFKALRPADHAALPAIIQGGLLHDVGKRGVPNSILNKVGKLTPKEWQIVRAHPRLGYAELRKHPGVPPVVLEMTRDHHERLDGKGYPNELARDKIGFASRVCAVADVYDALTSSRLYRKALSPRQALALMAEGVATHFDPGILTVWCEIVERLIALRPDGAYGPATVPARLSLNGFLPSCEVSGVVPAAASAGRDRRAHPRVPCNTVARTRFITQGRPCPVAVGEPFPALVVDFSATGVQLRTPWPFSLDDRLEVDLPRRDGSTTTFAGRVARVAAASEGRYVAGLRFVEAAQEPKKQAA